MFAKKDNFEFKKKRTPLKYISTGPGAVFIVTNNSYFETGLTELALYYFVSSEKSLCILDSKSFDNAFKLFEYLQYLDQLNANVEVLIINEALPNAPDNKSYCPWVLGQDVTVKSYKKSLLNISNFNGSLKSILKFYSMNLKRRKFSNTQSTILDYLVKGLSVNEIAQVMNASPKTVYSSIRKVCIAHNQRTLIQLVHFFCINKSSFVLCKKSLTGRANF